MVKMFFTLIAVAAAASKSRVFNYWGTPKASAPTTVWGDPVKGIDITGNAFNGRNGDGNDKNGHHGYRTKMGDAFVHTSSTEGAKLSMTNCEGLHSSAKNTNHCLIGGKCGPCPIQTKFPTPAPTPAPTVPVPHKCMRTGRRGKVLNPVAFGWAGVGADQKYCFLEHCKMCNKPKTYKGYGSERFCPMRAHQDATPDTGADTDDKPVRAGVCGKHEFSDKCEFVSCTYNEKQGMKVTVVQGDRGLGLFANNGKFLTGDQHECRANKNNKANRFDCECKCQTTKLSKKPTHADYKIINTGTCEESGYKTITDVTECGNAGKDLRINHYCKKGLKNGRPWCAEGTGFRFDMPKGGYRGRGKGRTAGCTIHGGSGKNGMQHFPTHSGKCGTANFHCVCKK